MRTRPSAAWLLPAAALAVWVPTYALALQPPPGQPTIPAIYLLYGLPYVAFAAVGGLIIRAERASRVGWVLAGIGLLSGLGALLAQVARQVSTSGSETSAGWILVVAAPAAVTATGLIVLLLLVFPDGRLPSPGWRWFVRFIGLFLIVVLLSQLTDPVPSLDVPGLPMTPLANRAVAEALAPFTSFWTFPAAVLVAAASLVVRYRAGGVVVRQQIKWLALAAVVLAVCEVGNILLGELALSGVVDAAGKLAVVAAIGIAVLRHRLYDVDLAISRGLAYGWLAVVVTAIYVVLVVGVGARVGSGAKPDLALSVVATIVVALISLPLRDRLQQLANRLVYGRRQAPYDSLAGFTRQLADRHAMGDVIPSIAAALGQGLRARAVAVRVTDDGTTVVWPEGTWAPSTTPDGSLPITHQGEEVGALSVWSDTGLTDAERRLLADLAHQAGLVLHNARLTEELERRLVELRASRMRLVAAQDAERRRFERDLHDGAQQDLVTLRMRLGDAERAADGDPATTALLREIREHTAAILESIRRLSRGLYPPLLQSQGLIPALTAHARRLPLPAEVHGPDVRFPADVETAVYFCCVEALQNVVKHARASEVRVTVADADDGVRFEVTDDGRGFQPGQGHAGSGLQNMTDRLEALGGRLDIRSDGTGTCVRGYLPAGDRARASEAPPVGFELTRGPSCDVSQAWGSGSSATSASTSAT